MHSDPCFQIPLGALPSLEAARNAFGPMKWPDCHHGKPVAGGDYAALTARMDAAIGSPNKDHRKRMRPACVRADRIRADRL